MVFIDDIQKTTPAYSTDAWCWDILAWEPMCIGWDPYTNSSFARDAVWVSREGEGAPGQLGAVAPAPTL